MSLVEIRIALVLSLVVAGITPAQAESATTALSVIEQQVTKGRAAKLDTPVLNSDPYGPMLIAMVATLVTIF